MKKFAERTRSPRTLAKSRSIVKYWVNEGCDERGKPQGSAGLREREVEFTVTIQKWIVTVDPKPSRCLVIGYAP